MNKKIKMKITKEGSPDGIHIERYESGKEYEVNEDLYKAFVNDLKAAEPVNDIPIQNGINSAPINKMAKTPENKDPENKDPKKPESSPIRIIKENGKKTPGRPVKKTNKK